MSSQSIARLSGPLDRYILYSSYMLFSSCMLWSLAQDSIQIGVTSQLVLLFRCTSWLASSLHSCVTHTCTQDTACRILVSDCCFGRYKNCCGPDWMDIERSSLCHHWWSSMSEFSSREVKDQRSRYLPPGDLPACKPFDRTLSPWLCLVACANC